MANEETYLLVDRADTEELCAPIRRSARLRYNCVSVSSRLVVFGTNTGGLYVFSQQDKKFLQVAFAEKETNSVTHVKISPHEKYVAFACGSNIHILDLKLESRSKAETLRSSSDLGDAMVTYLHWDPASTKLYIGDDVGRVSVFSVSSIKAKNLFSLPMETIMKLDSSIVQIDKASNKILVSTLTRCYLCDTNRQIYSQIGQKLRDGIYGACFLEMEASLPMIYCARPGSRIWEVDFEGNVLNTHQFKQLLGVPPTSVLNAKSIPEFSSTEVSPQSRAFPRLLVLRGDLLLTWTSSSIFVLDPRNVKVILWCNKYSDILDVCCGHEKLYVFLQTMEIQCVSFLPVTGVIPLFIKTSNLEGAAQLALHHRHIFLHKHVRKRFGVKELSRFHEKLLEARLSELAKDIKSVVKEVEDKMAEFEDGSTDSGRSRTGSEISVRSEESVKLAEELKGTGGRNSVKNEEDMKSRTDLKNAGNVKMLNGVESGKADENDLKFESERSGAKEDLESQSTVDITKEDIVVEEGRNDKEDVVEEMGHIEIVPGENSRKIVGDSVVNENNVLGNSSVAHGIENNAGEAVSVNSDNSLDEVDSSVGAAVEGEVSDSLLNGPSLVHGELKNGGAETKRQTEIIDINLCHTSDLMTSGKLEMGKYSEKMEGSGLGLNRIKDDLEIKVRTVETDKNAETMCIENSNHNVVVSDIIKTDEKLTGEDTCAIPKAENVALNYNTLHPAPVLGLSLSPGSHVSMVTSDYQSEAFADNVDDLGSLSERGVKQRRSSVTSLSSLSSAEVTFDTFPSGDVEDGEEIAVHVRRGKRKKHVRSAEMRKSGSPGLGRSLSTGSLKSTQSVREEGLTPPGSVSNVIEEDSISVYSNDSIIFDDMARTSSRFEDRDSADTQSLDRNPEVLSTGSPMTASGDFGLSADFSKSGEHSESGEYSRGTSSSSPRTTLKNLKEKVQSKGKNILRNIKEKNLVSKAKELVENLSQGSDLYLNAGGADTPDVTFDLDSTSRSDVTCSSELLVDDLTPDGTSSVGKCPVDLNRLEDITNETINKLEDLEISLDASAMHNTLFTWVTVLNETFYELHLRKYCSDIEMALNDSAEKVRNEVKDNRFMDEAQVLPEISNFSESEFLKCSCNSNSAILSRILSDKDFCYVKDPLNIPSHLLKDIADLAQACFDIDCHGNILRYQKDIAEKRGCDLLEEANTKVGICGCRNKRQREGSTEHSKARICEQMNSDIEELDDENTSDKQDTVVDKTIETIENNSEESGVMVRSKVAPETFDHGGGVTESVEHSVALDQNGITFEISDKDQNNTEIITAFVSRNVGEEKNRIKPSDEHRDKHCNTRSGEADEQGSQGLVTETEKDSDVTKNHWMTAGAGDQSVEESIDTVNVDEKYIERKDISMGFFIRCYLPYLRLSRVREVLLSGKLEYESWCGLVASMEVISGADGDRYGIEEKSIIKHQLQNQARQDHGSVLLGHISKLFQKRSSSLLETMVRCHPYIQPIDVLYFCKYHSVAVDTVFKEYMAGLILQGPASIREKVLSTLQHQAEACFTWLEMLLADDWMKNKVMDETGCPRCQSHKLPWKHKGVIDRLTRELNLEENKERLLYLFSKFGYWEGVLRLLKQSGPRNEQMTLILQLDDIQLITDNSDIGYLPENEEQWLQLFHAFKEAGNQSCSEDISDWSNPITWNNLAILLVRYVGPEKAVSLLQSLDLKDEILTSEFYQACLLTGMVQKHQRLILHSMLEKVDTYLWSERPTAVSPQLHYLAVSEKSRHAAEDKQMDKLQTLTAKLQKDENTDQLIEDPEVHWGVQTKINLLCPCCGIALKEPVSHEVPGVLLFKCGHGYHKLCLASGDCLLCNL